MPSTIDFYFDFGSPTSYLAYKRLQQLSAEYDLQINYKPVLLGAIFKATGNNSPVAVPAKAKWMGLDMQRYAERYGVEFVMNPNFPINTLYLMRGAVAAKQLDCLQSYMGCVFQAMWAESKDLGDHDTLVQVLASEGLDAKALMSKADEENVKETLKQGTHEAVEKGLFGCPAFIFEDEFYFGQDRLSFVEEKLNLSSR